MKKILSLVLAMLMIFSMVPAVFAAETSESDYQAAIEYLKALELYKGTTDGDAADELVERYQMALFTARMVTGRVDKAYWETDANDSGFTDIDELNAEALGGVCYAAQQGIVNGIGGSEFAPFDNVTYRDAIVMIVRALGFNYPASGYPWSYINKARELGVLDGITGVAYTAEVKREVIAQLLYNAINAEIKGETIAANVFGVEETIVMVTATQQVVYSANAALSVKSGMVRVAAVDAEGEPIGTEYYVPFTELGCKNLAAANKLVGTTVKLTHRGNFAEFLAVESLSKVFENTPDKKEVTYAINDGLLTLGGKTYYALRELSDNYSSINHAQGTLSGKDEIKIFKAFGAEGPVSTGTAQYVLAADGNIYAKSNPFVPYAVYSALVDAWFQVITDEVTSTPNTDNWVTVLNKTYKQLTAKEVQDLLAKTTEQVMGFARQVTGTFAPFATKIGNSHGVHYDYFEAIASDTDGDGDYDRVTMRPYELLRVSKQTVSRKVDGVWTNVTVFKTTSFKNPVNDALNGHFNGDRKTGEWMTTTEFKGISFTDITDDDDATPVDSRLGNVYLYRSTGISIDKVPNGAFVVAYVNDGINSEREIDIVEVIGGEKKNADDNAYVFQTYIRGYDSVTNNIIYGENYDTMYFGTYAVKNSSAFDYPHAKSDDRSKYTASTAMYVQQYWNKYVDVYVLNGAVIYIEPVDPSNDFVILDSFTDFTEDGLKAMAYSTKDGGYAEVTIGELNGWSLGGYDYELFMLLKQMTDLGLTVKDYPLPIFLNKIYAVRSVDENGAYNLVEPAAPKTDSIYVNNFGYILGVDQYGELNENGRVATSDKDLWIIQTQKNDANGKPVADKVVMFKGKLSTIKLVDFSWYKVADNQYVAVAPVGYELGPINGNTSEGLDYWMYNQYINNYKNETLFNGFYYGHYMTNVRSGAVEFVTYDSKLAKDLFANNPALTNNYIVLTEGEIYPATNKVLKDATYPDATNGLTQIRVNTATMEQVVNFEAANHKYHAYEAAAVGAVIPVGVNAAQAVAAGIFTSDIKITVNNYADLRDAIAANLHYGVYGDDFTNAPTGTDVYENIIKKELLANVTFIHRTATGTYQSWVGYNSSKGYDTFTGVLGTSTQVAKAYVLYDYANASAKVFIDSMPLVTPNNATANSTKAITDAVLGNVTAVMTTNFLANKTSVRIDYPAVALVSDVAINGFTVSNLASHGNFVTFDVAATDYEAIKAATWTITSTALTKITGVIPTDDTLGMANEAVCADCGVVDTYTKYTDTNGKDNLVNATVATGYAPLSKLFDGTIASAAGAQLDEDRIDPLTTVKLTGSSVCHKHSFTTFARGAHAVKGAHADTKAGFSAAVIAELPAAQKVDFARIYIPDNQTTASHFAVVNQTYAIMVSSDGINWTLANTFENMWDSTNGYVNNKVILGAATDTTNKYLLVEFELDNVPATTKYVAVGWVDNSGWGANYSASKWNMTEIEFYAAPAANLT